MKRLLIPILLISSSSFAAGIQKWVDESGQVHYGDRPPVKTSAEPVQVSRPPSNPGKPLPRFTGSQNADKPATHPDNLPVGEETSESQAQQACEQARKDVSTLNRSTRLRLKSPDGTERYMTAEEIAERRTLSENDIKQFCK